MDDLAPGLAYGTKRSELAIGCRYPELFLKFAPRHVDCGFILSDLALWYRPDAFVASLPEGTAGMDQEHLELPVRPPVQKQAGALDAQLLGDQSSRRPLSR